MSWTPAELRWALDHLRELALYARPAPRLAAQPRRRRDLRPPPEFVTAERLADLQRAIRVLRAEDPDLVSVVTAAYVRPDLLDLRKSGRLAAWSAERGVSMATAWRRLARAERRLLQILNGDGELEAGADREGEGGCPNRGLTAPSPAPASRSCQALYE